MGFFRKLFGGDDAPPETEATPAPAPAPEEPAAPAPAALDDPYRGPAFVEADAVEEAVVVGPAAPIFHYRGRVLALEPNRRGPLPLRWMVYTGLANDALVLRKLTFGEKGYRVDWEHITEFPDAYDGYVARIGDRIVMPRKTGFVAFHLATGRKCWELPHPAALQQQPRLDKAGNLVLVFADQSWMVVALRDGATVSEGVARNDRDVENLIKGTHELGQRLRDEARYGGATVEIEASVLRVKGGRSTADAPAAPTGGEYPFDGEWEGGGWLALAGGKLVVQMEHGFGDKRWGAIGLLDPTSLEPLQLLELGQVTTSLTGWAVDELIVVDTDLPDTPDDVMFIIDPESERVVALLREGKADAFLFDRAGNRIWAAPV